MKRIILGIFVGILLWTLGCTINQGEGMFNVEAEITQIGNTILSVKYNIGRTIMFDDITMKDSPGILSMIRENHKHTIPLGIVIEFNESEESNHNEASIKYYYGANFLSESKSFDLTAILRVAKSNPEIFNWVYKDGKFIKEDKKEPVELKSSDEVVNQPVKKELSEKL